MGINNRINELQTPVSDQEASNKQRFIAALCERTILMSLSYKALSYIYAPLCRAGNQVPRALKVQEH